MIFLRKFTTTPLKLARAAFPLQLGGMDFSPIILILGLSFLANFLKMSMLFVGSGGSITKILPIFIFCLLMLVSTLVWFLLVIMIARVIMSLIDPSPYNPIVMLVYGLTEPLLAPFGRASKGGLDIRALIVTAIIFLFNHYALVWLIARTRTWILSTNMVIL
jgi:YggT family protein